MKSFKTHIVVFMSLLALFSLAGCGGSNQVVEETADTEVNKPQELVKWVHGVIKPQEDSSFVYMAKEKEFFKKHGIDIEYQEFISAPVMSQALSSGAIDSAESNPVGAIFSAAQGGDIKIIGSTMPGLDLAVYAQKELESIEDLQGKKIGTSAPGDLPDLLMRAIFQKEGLDPENASYAAVGGKGDRLKALKEGAIDADVNSLENLPEIEADPNLHLVAIAEDIVPEFPRLTIMVSESRIKSKPEDAIVGFLAAMMEGLQYALDNPDEAKLVAEKNIGAGANENRITSYYNLAVERNWPDPRMEFDKSRLTWLQDFLISIGRLDKEISIDEIFDMSYRDKAFEKVFGNQN